jgi:hypothetical protein
LTLLGRQTGESIMMFEETLPAGTKSLFHLHRDSDEVAWALAARSPLRSASLPSAGPAPARFMSRNVQHAGKNSGSETGRVVCIHSRPPPVASLKHFRSACPNKDDERQSFFSPEAYCS